MRRRPGGALAVPAMLVLVASILSACTGAANSPTPSLTVFAAASLRDALTAAASAYEGVAPGVSLAISTDSSATLRTQIEQGAPVDVFLSADTSNPQALADAGLTDGAPIPFAGNTLAIIVPAGNPAGFRTPADLARAGVKVIAAGDQVPITRYATEVVAELAGLDGYPADFAAAYATNVVSKEDNVKAIVAKIALGEGDAAIVYVTDATAAAADVAADVATIAIPDAANVTATYAGVVVKATGQTAEARAFLGWLAGPDGQAVLAEFGFRSPV